MIKFFEKHSKTTLVITLLLAIFIFYMSSRTFSPSLGSGISILSIIYHIAVFFVFSAFLFLTLIKGKHKGLFPIAIVMALLYATSDELHQFLVPGRHLSLGDILLDAIGIGFAFMLYSIILLYRKR